MLVKPEGPPTALEMVVEVDEEVRDRMAGSKTIAPSIFFNMSSIFCEEIELL